MRSSLWMVLVLASTAQAQDEEALEGAVGVVYVEDFESEDADLQIEETASPEPEPVLGISALPPISAAARVIFDYLTTLKKPAAMEIIPGRERLFWMGNQPVVKGEVNIFGQRWNIVQWIVGDWLYFVGQQEGFPDRFVRGSRYIPPKPTTPAEPVVTPTIPGRPWYAGPGKAGAATAVIVTIDGMIDGRPALDIARDAGIYGGVAFVASAVTPAELGPLYPIGAHLIAQDNRARREQQSVAMGGANPAWGSVQSIGAPPDLSLWQRVKGGLRRGWKSVIGFFYDPGPDRNVRPAQW